MTVAILSHCIRFYELLDAKAEDETLNGEKVRVYTGKITEDFNSLRLASPYYSKTTQLLTQMGCVTQLQRGGRVHLSRWAIHYPPTEELFANIDPDSNNLTATRELIKTYREATSQQIRDMRRQLEGAKKSQSETQKVLGQLLARVEALENLKKQ